MTNGFTEHWTEKVKRKERTYNLKGARNYIRIPAKAFVIFQQFKNSCSGKKQSLYEASESFQGEE